MVRRVVVFGCLVALGCGTSPAESPVSMWCGALCVADERCGDTRLLEECRNDCVGFRPGLVNLSANGARAWAPCIEKLSCTAILGDEAQWKTEMDACWQQAQLSVEVTPESRAFCPDDARAWFECGYSLPVDECERRFSMWATSVVDKLSLCLDQPTCDGLQTCDTAVFADL